MQDKEQQQKKQPERRDQPSIQLELLSLGGDIESWSRKKEASGVLAIEE